MKEPKKETEWEQNTREECHRRDCANVCRLIPTWFPLFNHQASPTATKQIGISSTLANILRVQHRPVRFCHPKCWDFSWCQDAVHTSVREVYLTQSAMSKHENRRFYPETSSTPDTPAFRQTQLPRSQTRMHSRVRMRGRGNNPNPLNQIATSNKKTISTLNKT